MKPHFTIASVLRHLLRPPDLPKTRLGLVALALASASCLVLIPFLVSLDARWLDVVIGALILLLAIDLATSLLRISMYYPEIASLPFLGSLVALVILAFAMLYEGFGVIGPGEKISRSFLDCLYFSVITFTTVGYGDFRPTPHARPIVAFEALAGYWFLGLFIAAVAARWARPRTDPPQAPTQKV